jgi:hypothetical protein
MLGLAGPAAAGEQVPFKGRFEAVVTMMTPLQPPFVFLLVEGTGNATHLGRFTLTSPVVGDTSTQAATGTYEFTAANGDTLTADFTGQATPTPIPGVLFIVDTATITGGTGRFADATGSFISTHVFDPATGITIGSFDGTISSPGAGRR